VVVAVVHNQAIREVLEVQAVGVQVEAIHPELALIMQLMEQQIVAVVEVAVAVQVKVLEMLLLVMAVQESSLSPM
jgi:hypothetical protein